MLGHILGGVVGEPGSLGSAGTGNDTNTGADDGGQEHGTDHPLPLLLGDLAVVLLAQLTGLQIQLIPLQLGLGDDLNQSEQTDQHNSGIQAQIQSGNAEGEAVIAGHGVSADAGDQQTQAGSDDALGQALAGNTGDDGHTEQADHEILGSAQHCGDLCHLGTQEQQHQSGEDTAEGGSIQGDLQSGLGTALLGQGMAVHHGGSSMGGAGGVDQNGGN